MAYQMTPAERRARAQALKEQRENRSLYSRYTALQKEQEAREQQAQMESVWAENQKKNQNFFVRAASTIGELAANVLTGAVKGLEGIYDLGAGVVGAVGGIFDSDFQDRVKQHISYDWTSETIGNPLQEALKYSYLKEGGIIENVASGIGQMLPAVAVSVATGGLGAPAAMAQTASLLTLGASAAGNSTEEAFKDGAGYYQGLGYGLASGAVEIATEKMFGGATKALTGAGLLDGVARSVADTGIKRIVKNAAEEGIEEIVSELTNPLLKSIYKGKDALDDYGTADYWKGVGQAGLVGSLTALAYSGTVGYGLSKVGIGYVGKEADIADSLSEISSLKEKGTNLQNSGKLNEQMEIKIADTVKKNYQNIEKVLQKTSAEKRAKLIKKFSLDKAFTAEGKMSEQLGSWLSDTTAAEQTNADGGEKPTTPLASPKKDYYSFGLRGSEQTIQSDLQKMTEDRRQAYARQNGVTVEEAAKKIGDIKVFDGVMSEQAQERFTKMKQGLNILNKTSGANISFVVTEANDLFNGTIVDDRTMYIGADTFENDTWAGTLVHEYTHLAEGSEEYNKLFNYLASDDIQVDDGKGGKVKLWQKAQESVLSQNYGFTEDQLKKIVDKANSGAALTEQEAKYYDAFRSEVGARMSEYLLGNESFIDKIVAKDSSFAKKFISKIQNLIKMFKRLGSESKAEFKQLKKAENLYLAAARKAGNQALVRKILKAREERGEQTSETSGEVKKEKKSEKKPKKRQAKKQGAKYSLKDGDVSESSLAEYDSQRESAYKVEQEAKKKLDAIPGYEEQKEKLYKILGDKSATNEDIDAALKAYAEWEKKSGYGEAYREYQEASRRTNELRRESERVRENLAKKLLDKKYTAEEISKFVQKAVRRFHTTPYLNRASYLLTTGSMLDFSDGQSYRVQDHREISEVLDLPDYAEYSTGMIVFMNMGNIRLQTYGIDIAAMPNEKQISSLRNIISKIMAEYDEFVVDFSKSNGDTDGSITYPRSISSARIISDIKKYFETGVLPEEPSSLSQFRYSLKDSQGNPLTREQERFFADSKVRDKNGNLLVVYHGTKTAGFNIFEYSPDRQTGTDYGKAFYFTSDHTKAQGYSYDITKDTRISQYKAQRERLLRQYLDNQTEANKQAFLGYGKNLDSLLNDESYVTEGGEVKSVYLNLINPLVVNAEGEYYFKVYDEYFRKARAEGRDGIIIKNVIDNPKGKPRPIDVYIAFDNTQIKSIGNKNPSNSTDIRFSLKDSEGKALSEGQREYFAESKVRDDEGNLLVVYHGTMSGEFTVFDASYANVESDMGAGFYFSSSYSDVNSNYEEGGQDLEAKIERLAERLEYEDEIDYEEAKEKARAQLLKSSKLFEVYLDMKNPAYVGGNYDNATNLFEDLVDFSDIQEEDYDNEDDYWEARYERQEEALQELVEDVNRILESEGIGGYEGWEATLFESSSFDEMTITELKELFSNNLEAYDDKGNLANNEIVRAIVEALGYDGIIDNSVVDKWGYNSGRMDYMEGLDEETRHYIVFKPEQIKLTTNLNPTSNKDIRFSLKDSQGRTLSEGQREFFKNSKALDEDGNLLVVYHGTQSGEFTVFEHGKGQRNDAGWLGEGYYFYGDKHEAQIYAMNGGRLIEAYLNVENPYYATAEDMEHLAELDDVEESRAFTERLIEEGYDSVYYNGDLRQEWCVFNPNQIKLTTNKNPSANEDIRFSLKDDPSTKKYFAELTDGQVKKLLADNTKLKVYSKVEAEGIVNNIISNYLDFGEKYGVISGKTKKQAIEMLWRGLNTADPGKQMKVALDIAEYIIQNSVMESVYDDMDNETHTWTISLLKPYLHSIDLSHIKGEIKYRYGNDNSAYLLWGKRKGEKGMGVDQIAQILEEQGMKIDALNEAEIFLEIDSAYRSAVAALKNKAKTLLSSAMSSTERKTLKQQIAREVLLGFTENGKPSKLSKIIDKYRSQANVWKKAYYEERSKNKVLNRLLDKVQKLKDIKLGTFLNASQFKSDIFKGSIEKLANIKYRGNLNEAGTRKIVASLSEWYVKDNPMLEGAYEDEVADMLRSISEGEGKLTVDELKTLENVVDYFKHFIETYNKVYRNGEFVDAQPIAQNYVKLLHENKSVKVGWFAKLSGMKYFKTFADPMTVARRMDLYGNGFYTEMLERLREGAVGASVMEMEMREPLEEFYKKNKKYLKELSKRTIKYQGKDIPLSQALLLYMTLNREQAIRGLAESGFTYTEEKETVRINGFAEGEGEELTIEQMKEMAKGVQDELSKQFSELDKEYISIAEKLFNETCKQAKRETDIKRKGYSNALDDYYVPIRRAYIAHNVDTSTFADEMNRVSNASFNKDTVKGAKNELYIEALDSVLDRHIRAVAQYANLSLAIDEYNKLFNLDIGDNPNKPQSVRTESVDTWREGDSYFKKLISDVQGIPVVKGEGTKFMSFIRGGYAKFQLGANPKVWVTQLSSFAAAGSILDLGSITRGLSIKTADVDEYCPLAKLRNNDNTVALAQGVLDKVGKVGNALMIPIGKVDRFVVKRLFGACQVQVEKDSGLKIGTEENKVKAGELLKKVILETQQNAMATERSAAMRSGNELMKTLTMFTADSMKVIGRVIDAVGELSVLKAKLKVTTDSKQIAELNEKIKQANKKTRKAIASLVASAVFMALVAQLFRTLYNRDDDDDNIAVNMTVDAIGNLFGGLPIIKDIYARFTEGYDLDNYAYSAINDLFDSAEGIFDMVGNIFSGEWDSKQLAKNAKDLLFTSGQILGLPTRNIYNIGYGLIKRFSPSTAYKIDDMFYNQNYRTDLNKAIEKDDEEMISTIVGIMLDDNIGGIKNSSARKELDKLVKAGYNVIPKSVGNSVTYEGEEHALSSKQVKEFNAIYSTANEALASLVTLSQYTSATDEVKAKAVNFVFDTYYNLALQDFLGVEIESKNVLFAEAIDIEKLAIIIAMARSLTADMDKNGNAISGTRKAKVQSYINSLKLTAAQKYMIMGYLGYTNTKGEAQVKAYINRLKLTKSEKKKLLKYSGYSA